MFEHQTAIRVVENMAIERAHQTLFKSNNESIIEHKLNKLFKFEYCKQANSILQYDAKYKTKKQLIIKDCMLMEELETICKNCILNGYLESPIKFFCQHNRSGYIFRGGPCYQKKIKHHGMIGHILIGEQLTNIEFLLKFCCSWKCRQINLKNHLLLVTDAYMSLVHMRL